MVLLNKLGQVIRGYLTQSFSLDTRSISLFRLCLGIVICLDVIIRTMDAGAFYTESGMLPVGIITDLFPHTGRWSLYFMLRHEFLIYSLLGIHLVFAIFYTLALYPKFSGFITWVLLCSIQARNPGVLQGGDAFLRMILLWSLFLPLNSAKQAKQEFSLASFILILQILAIYIMNGHFKNHPLWHTEKLAVWYAINIDMLTTSLGVWLRDYVPVTKFLTIMTYYLEVFGPILFFIRFKKFDGRIACLILFIGFHLSLEAFMYLGLFPFICVSAWLVTMPKSVWQLPIAKKIEKLLINIESRFIRPNFLTPFAHRFFKWPVKIYLITGLIYVLMWNLRTTNFQFYQKYFPRSINFVGFFFNWDQYWNMFSPFPLVDDGYFIIEGIFKSGKRWDIFNHQEVDFQFKPKDIAGKYVRQRWRKFHLNVWMKKNKKTNRYYANYICQNEKKYFPDDLLKRINIYFMHEKTRPPGQPVNLIKKSIVSLNCD